MTSPDNEGLTREEAERLDRAMGAFDNRPVTLPPSVRDAIMRRIREAPASPWRRMSIWLVVPRPLQASPLALALGLLVIIASSVIVGSRMAVESRTASASGAGAPRAARFLLVEPGASTVTVTGTFLGWDPAGVPLRRLADGLWIGEVPLRPGIHYYGFVVDGTQWRPDPNAAWSVDDGLGRQNSVVVIPGPERSL